MRFTIGARIKQARRQKGLTQKELSQLCGWSDFPARVSNYERGQREPKSEHLGKLADALSVSIDWFYKSTDNVLAAHENRPRYGTANMVPVLEWVQIIPYLEDQPLPRDIKTLPMPDHFGKRCFNLIVDGDSMESPQGVSFLHRDHIVIDPDATAETNDYVLAKMDDNHVVFKQLTSDMGLSYLKPLNPRYPIIEMTANMEILGVVKSQTHYFE